MTTRGAALQSEGAVVPGAQGHSAGPFWAGWEADPAHGVTAIAPGLPGITHQTALLDLLRSLGLQSSPLPAHTTLST